MCQHGSIAVKEHRADIHIDSVVTGGEMNEREKDRPRRKRNESRGEEDQAGASRRSMYEERSTICRLCAVGESKGTQPEQANKMPTNSPEKRSMDQNDEDVQVQASPKRSRRAEGKAAPMAHAE